MFICEKCVKNYVVSVHLEFCPKSRGPCEYCRWIRICYDLPPSSYYHKDSEYAKKLRKENQSFNPSER